MILLGLSSVIFYDRIVQIPFAAKTYERLGIHSTNNLRLEDITLEETADDESLNLKISGFIINGNKHKAYVPNLRISVRDLAGNELLGYTMENKNDTLLPNDRYNFTNIVTNLSPYAETVVIEIGNQIELLQR